MASLGEVGGQTVDKMGLSETKNRPKKFYFGVFFDGTGNNMIQRGVAEAFRNSQVQKSARPAGSAAVGAGTVEIITTPDNKSDWDLELNTNLNKYGANSLKDTTMNENGDYSNVAILHSVYQGISPEKLKEEEVKYDVYRYNIYVEGPGTTATNETNVQGSVFGTGSTGVASLVCKAVKMVRSRIKAFDLSQAEIHFHVFGFSRGAAAARLFSYLVGRSASEKLPCEKEFRAGEFLHFLDDFPLKNEKKTVDFLGIYDTVSSIGSLSIDSYRNNVTDYGLYSPNESQVKHTFHLCALDEFRDHFAVTDIGSAADMNGNAEIFIPGCHTDVGGGYITGWNKFQLSYPTLMYIGNPQNTNGVTIVLDITGNALSVLGWFDRTNSDNSLDGKMTSKIECRRLVYGGYSNIPLKMMSERAIKDCQSNVFAMNAVSQKRFNIPDSIQELGESMVSFATSVSGRKFYFPNGTYLYKKLRNNYIHFSATDELLNTDEYKQTKIAMGPSRNKKNELSRIVYTGNKGNNRPHYLCDYNL